MLPVVAAFADRSLELVSVGLESLYHDSCVLVYIHNTIPPDGTGRSRRLDNVDNLSIETKDGNDSFHLCFDVYRHKSPPIMLFTA